MILFIGLIFTIVLTMFVGAASSPLSAYLDTVSLMIVLLPVVFFLIITKSGRVIGRYIKGSFSKSPEYSTAELLAIAAAAKNTRKVTVAAGCFGFLMGVCALFANIGDDNLALILMRNMSVALITLIYSLVLGFFVFFPLQAWAENKIADSENANEGG